MTLLCVCQFGGPRLPAHYNEPLVHASITNTIRPWAGAVRLHRIAQESGFKCSKNYEFIWSKVTSQTEWTSRSLENPFYTGPLENKACVLIRRWLLKCMNTVVFVYRSVFIIDVLNPVVTDRCQKTCCQLKKKKKREREIYSLCWEDCDENQTNTHFCKVKSVAYSV